MDKNALKELLCREIDRRKDEIIGSEKFQYSAKK